MCLCINEKLMEGKHFLLGEVCVPYTLRKSKAKDGVVKTAIQMPRVKHMC